MRKIKFELDGNLDVLNLEAKENTDIADVREALKAKCVPKLNQFAAVELKLSLITDGNVVELDPTALHSVIPDGSTVVIHHPPYKTEVSWKQSVDSPLPLASCNLTVNVSSSTSGAASRSYPRQLSRWSSFTSEAAKLELPNEKSDWKENMFTPQPFVREAQVWAAVEGNVGNFFAGSSLGRITQTPRTQNVKRKSSQVEYESMPTRVPVRSQMARGDPDLVGLDLAERIVGTIEAKTPWAIDLDDEKFLSKYNGGQADAKYTSTLRAIAQTIGYMMDNDTRYGVLTTYNSTRFFRAVSVDHVEVSDPIYPNSLTSKESSTVTLRRAFAYWLTLCRGQDSLMLYDVPRRLTNEYNNDHGKVNSDGTLVSSTSDSNIGPSESIASGLLNVGDLLKSTDIQQTLDSLLCNHSLYVEWSSIQILDGLGGGRCGTVALAFWKGRKIALKLFDIGKYGSIAFQNELQAHSKLLGTCARVTKLVLVTISPSGQVFGLGMELGREMPPLATWTQEQRASAFKALQSMLEAGNLIQNDVRDGNFVRDKSGALLVIDLEDTSFSHSQEESDLYLSAARAYLMA